jgi:hypothetical protein
MRPRKAYREQAMSMAGGPGRIPALVFVGVVIVAIAALLVGYGVPVGVGALAGFVLGATAGAVSALWLGRGAGRSVNIAGMSWSSDMAWQVPLEADQPDEVLATRMLELSALFAVDLGRIRSVQPMLVATEAGGYELELVTIEHHEAGATLALDVRTLPGATALPSMVDVSVADDLGTPYRAIGQGAGGGPGHSRYEVRILPAIPEAARELSIRIERFVELYPGHPAGPRPAIGPWSFSVAVVREEAR